MSTPELRHAIRWNVKDLGQDSEALAKREALAMELLVEWGAARNLEVDPAYGGRPYRSSWDHGRRETWALGFLNTPARFSRPVPRLGGFGVTGEEVLEGKEEDASAFLAATLPPGTEYPQQG